MKKDVLLSHFIDWKKVSDDQTDKVMSALISAGVQNIVLHPEWAERDRMDGCYLKMITAKLKKTGLSSTACHGLWGDEYDLNCPDETRRKQIMRDHIVFINKAADIGCLTYVIHPGDHHDGYTRQYPDGRMRKSLDDLIPIAEHAGIKIWM